MNWLIVTTTADHSANFFANIHEKHQTTLINYDEAQTARLLKKYDVVYFRDPFNTGQYDLEAIAASIKCISERFPSAYYIDQAHTLEAMLIEDKWRQYQLLADYMPRTQILKNSHEVTADTIAKKRISSRAKGIAFRPEDIEVEVQDYILQSRMKITHEYRVYIIDGEPLDFMTGKSPKTETSKVKVNDYQPLTAAIRKLVMQVMTQFPTIDFAGIDIAESDQGLKVIEINRSPQFQRYNERSNNNIADTLMRSVERKINDNREGTLMADNTIKRKMKVVVGRVERVNFPQFDVVGVPAKIDTGAFRSSVWASEVKIENDKLSFTLFDKRCEWFTGKKYTTSRYEVVEVENSFGHKQERYSVHIKIKMGPKVVSTNFTLSDRSMKIYPVLIGRKLLKGRYLVDVAEGQPLEDEETI